MPKIWNISTSAELTFHDTGSLFLWSDGFAINVCRRYEGRNEINEDIYVGKKIYENIHKL